MFLRYDWSKMACLRDQRMLAMVTLLGVALFSTACSGSTAQGGTPGCAKVNSGCYAVAIFNRPNVDYNGNTPPASVFSSFTLRSLTCDNTCVQANGFIGNYLLLGIPSLQNWVEVGYRNGAVTDSYPFFFTAAYNGSQIIFHDLMLVQGGDLNNYGDFAVNAKVGPRFYVRYATPSGWSFYDWGDFIAFAPAAAEIGQILHSTGGAAANIAYFSATSFRPLADLSMLVAPPFSAYYTNNFFGQGVVKTDNPPYGQWGVFDTFQTACCTPIN